MPIPEYNQGYPPDQSSLGQTKTTIRNNLDGTFLTLGVDHINNNGLPGTQPAGYHNITHWVPQAGNPVAVTGYGQLYSKTVNADQALFWETGNGLVQQLTTNITPSAAANGRSFLPGGIIIQWGSVTSALPNNGSVNFFAATGLAFPNNCFNVQTTPFYGVSAPNTNPISIAINGLTATGFNWLALSASNKYTGFYWTAIGN
jgi:hypothetical protein